MGLLPFLGLLVALGSPQQPDPGLANPALVDDILVTGRAHADRARVFVGRVAAPARGRGLGRWRSICPAVVNLKRPAAQAVIDRLARTALDLGVGVEEAGCAANLVIIFTPDGQSFASTMVNRNRRVFRPASASGLDRGEAALRAFESSDRPVRWWHSSMPIDSQTGQRAVRVAGDWTSTPLDANVAAMLDCQPQDCPLAMAPTIASTGASRLNTQIIDEIYKAVLIIDIDAVAGLNTAQLGDYLAMVSLAQIDPDGEVGGFDTILNMFEDPAANQGLSDWDRSYLEALYGSPSRRTSTIAQIGAVAAIMNRDGRTQPQR